MTDIAVLWIVGLACLIVALIGKAVTIGSVQLPETAEKKARAGMAVVGSIALVLGILLFIRPNGYQQPAQATATSGPITTPSTSQPSIENTQAATPKRLASNTPSSSPRPTITPKPFYIAALNGTTAQDLQAAAPETGSWRLGTDVYANSLGYTADNNLCDLSQSITYTIPGSYRFLVATVGVSDTPSDTNGQGVTVSFEVDDGSGNQLGAQSADYEHPGPMRVDIQGAASLTLVTSSSKGCFGSDSTEAVWGNVELIP